MQYVPNKCGHNKKGKYGLSISSCSIIHWLKRSRGLSAKRKSQAEIGGCGVIYSIITSDYTMEARPIGYVVGYASVRAGVNEKSKLSYIGCIIGIVNLSAKRSV